MEVALLVAEPNVSRSAVDQHYFILDHTSSDPAQRIGRKWQLQLAAPSALNRRGSCMLKTNVPRKTILWYSKPQPNPSNLATSQGILTVKVCIRRNLMEESPSIFVWLFGRSTAS